MVYLKFPLVLLSPQTVQLPVKELFRCALALEERRVGVFERLRVGCFLFVAAIYPPAE
jgi:hypothetical protein